MCLARTELHMWGGQGRWSLRELRGSRRRLRFLGQMLEGNYPARRKQIEKRSRLCLIPLLSLSVLVVGSWS